jgi:hypothetical protein
MSSSKGPASTSSATRAGAAIALAACGGSGVMQHVGPACARLARDPHTAPDRPVRADPPRQVSQTTHATPPAPPHTTARRTSNEAP